MARETGYHPRLSQKQQNVVIISPFREIYPIRSYVEMVTSEPRADVVGARLPH
ncbi:MAG: hypothetical protein L6W00_22845 [Lentisphaeria bacterium]|nr:MAG: hypothetical protein L6W00_22845 [Lentisphaeria bacterium]